MGNQIESSRLYGIYAREADAERVLDEARARAVVELGDAAKAELDPNVSRAAQRLRNAKLQRIMAEHRLAGHLTDGDS